MALTRQGDMFGTLAYMAPELFRGNSTDHRCDIYSVGCILYELLTGQPPFLGRNIEVMHAHTTRQAPPPSQRRPDASINAAVDRLVLRCLHKQQSKRFQSGEELAHAIEQIPKKGTEQTF